MNYQIHSDKIILIVSSYGAEMQSIKKDGREYLWNGDETYWGERSPVLFPYVGRFTDGRYKLWGAEYEMHIHGFAKESEFVLVRKTENQLVFKLADTDQTYQIYPFHFSFLVSYTVLNQEIFVEYQIYNLSDDWMYFGLGGHPGFRLPFEDGVKFEDYELEFGMECNPDRVGHTETCFLNGVNTPYPLKENKRILLHHGLFDDDAIVLQNMADSVTLKTDKGMHRITLHYPKFPYLGIWHTPKTEAPYVCIEPWTSLPSRQDIVENICFKPDLVRLESRGTYTNCWSMCIE